MKIKDFVTDLCDTCPVSIRRISKKKVICLSTIAYKHLQNQIANSGLSYDIIRQTPRDVIVKIHRIKS